MHPTQSSSPDCAHLSKSRTCLGKRVRNYNWHESQSKRKRLNNGLCKRAKGSSSAKEPQKADHRVEPTLTATSLPEEWTLLFTLKTLELWLTPERVERLGLQDGLSVLSYAPSRPLITRAHLSELDFIVYDPKFRHDINFDSKSVFQPRCQGDKVTRNSIHERQYWEAMSIEFALYAQCHRLLASNKQSPSWLLHSSVVPGISIPWRFPQMLADLSDLVCMVVPRSMWDCVRQRFDVLLIMQKLSRGIFKLDTLVEWLGMLLQRSCAPHRDGNIRAAVAATSKAVYKEDVKGTVLSLKGFFRIIETMKLDTVNYCIKQQRVAIIDATVAHQQTHFRQEMENKRFSPMDSQRWFRSIVYDTRRVPYDSLNPQDVLTEGIIGLVTSSSSHDPSTLSFDGDRLRCLRTRYRYKLHKQIIRRALAHFASKSECDKPGASTTSAQHLLSRIDALVEPADLASRWTSTASTVALEIARCLPDLNGLVSLPTPALLQEVETFLQDAESERSKERAAAEKHLQEKLRPLVAREVKTDKSLTLAQLSNRCRARLEQHQRPMTQHEELETMARKIAHLSVLHWRVWGPILYAPLLAEQQRSNAVEMAPKVAELGSRGSCTSNLLGDANDAILHSASTRDKGQC